MTIAPPRPRAAPSAVVAGAARGGAANLAGAVTASLAGFGVTWLVARVLGTGRAGAFFAATAAFALLGTVAKLGTETGLVYFIARLRTFGAPAGAYRRCLRVALVPVAVVTAGVAVALWFGAPLLSALTARGEGHGYAAVLRVLAFFLPLAALSDALLAGTRGWRVMRPTVVIEKILRPAVQLALLATLTLLAVRVPALFALCWALPYALSACLAGYVLLRLLPSTDARPSAVDGADAGSFWRFTGPRAAASVAQLALGRLDLLLLAGMAGLGAAAVYAVAGRFIVLGQFANQAISQSVQPRLAELLALGDRAGARALYQTATGWLVVASWPMYLVLAAVPSVYLGLFGRAYRDAGAIVAVLACAMLLATACGMVDMVLAMAGRTTWNLVNVIVAVGVNLAVDLQLIPKLGALGAAIGLAASIIANNLIPLVQVALLLRIHPFGAGTCSAMALALLCFGVPPLAVTRLAPAHLFAANPAGAALAAAAIGAGGYLIALLRLRGVLRLDAFLALRRRTQGGQ